ncbi:MAG: transporter substrate-binding domain-containing protein [Alteromonadaceae bacterium]|jgi:polar amino acid transport system substrate-binding protein|tara:strand:+ start:249 stop:1046 length:798 start_codon:yes stop_codon:yes gene_type:complete
MKSPWLSCLFLTLTGFTLLLQSHQGQTTELIACGHPYYPPVSWLEQQQLVGVAPAVVKLIFGELGYQVKLDKLGNWKRCLTEVQAGHADVVVAAYRIASRESDFDFSEQHIVADPIGVFINQNKSNNYQSLNDLKDKTVGLLFGDSFGDSLDQFIVDHNQIEYVSEGEQNLKKLAQGRIDFIPLGISSGKLQTQKFGYSQQVIAAPFKLETEYYYLALGRHSKLKQHLPYINQRLNELHQTGKIQQLVTQYSKLYLETLTKADSP